MSVLVLDNGAGCAKVGYSTDKEPRILPNCVTKAKNVRTRIFIGDQVDDCKDLSGLYYLLPFQKNMQKGIYGVAGLYYLLPFQKGFLVNWDLEKQVWDYVFSKEVCQVNFNETTLVVTEPCFNFVSIQEAMNEIIFEEYQFSAALRTNASTLSEYKCRKSRPNGPKGCLVVDSGYSFSHVVPYKKGTKVTEAVKRISVGGKLLSNHLKEVISYRQLMVMDETYVINQMKEDVCYVSTQFSKDMDIAKKKGKENTVVRDYILPDYTHIKRGFVRPEEETSGKPQGNEQIIRMNNERFAIPELLFHPSDVGIQEMGISETIVHSINQLPEEVQPHLFNNILLTGGNCMLPGFRDRVFLDVRSLAPAEFDVYVSIPTNPVQHAWEGGALLAADEHLKDLVVTKQEYEEHGQAVCFEKFDV